MFNVLSLIGKKIIGEIVIYKGYRAGKSISLYADEQITIGRSKKNKICIPDCNLSEIQMSISTENDCIYICNKSGKTITVDNIPIDHDNKIPIYNYAEIEMGLSSFHISFGKLTNKDSIKSEKMKKVILIVIVGLLIMSMEWFLFFKKKMDSGITINSPLKTQTLDEDQMYTQVTLPNPTINGAPPQIAIDSAVNIFKAAEQIYKERFTRNESVSMAMDKYNEGINILTRYSDRSSVLQQLEGAVQSLKNILIDINKFYKISKSEVDMLIEKGDYYGAKQRDEEIMNLIPDIKDLRNVWAKKKLEQIYKKLDGK